MRIRENEDVVLDGKKVQGWEEMKSVYVRRLEKFGLGHETFFYDDELSHTTKLACASRILSSIVDPRDGVLDVGCGIGALVPCMPVCAYRGIDLVPEFIEAARKRYPDLRFDCTNITDIRESYDWVALVGVTATTPMPELVIRKAWELAEKGVVVDLIDSTKDPGDGFNTYRLGACAELFLAMGAGQIQLYPTRRTWTFVVAHKQPLWL